MKPSTAPTATSGSPSPDQPLQPVQQEMAALFDTEDPVRVEAARWHTCREQGCSPQQEAQFQRWLSASTAHGAAYARIEAGLAGLNAATPALRRNAASAAPATIQARGASGGSWWQRHMGARWRPRFNALALCCVMLLGCGLATLHWLGQRSFHQSFAVRQGERMELTLPDGTELALDSGTALEVTLLPQRREVHLTSGQAMFHVAHDSSRPFVVETGATRVTVLGTRFSVRRGNEDAVEVAVEQGHVMVTSTAPDHPAQANLLAGQTVQASASGLLGAVRDIDPASIAPWRRGLLHFTSTPLAQALQEFERYGPSHVFVRDPVVAAMQVGGSYRLDSPQAFAQTMPRILPVRLVQAPNGDIEIVRR
ncbi:anti-FecI sigma factor FecR [Herbaspirillum rubrisubalbicans M1]|uniref:FecR family protein n=1 Tax=Herbaspirillum rubrisubalbicans TaxID=80842 RepID=UPI00073A64BA|nr:FecR family protein [Herbaspirillum rubrisubalbicans]ALU89447.1 anti-FecI sigma factor FecR [Herbaspirillum rubrisubalbicans M1]